MKAPSPAPLYATILPVLVEHARALGYALAVHGTLARDLDLVAVPWVDGAAPAEDLVRSLAQQIAWTQDNLGYLVQGPEKKPHGRLAWTIPLVGDAFVDLSVCNGSGMRPPPKADAAVTTCVYPPGFERDLSVPCTRCGLTADIEAIANGLPPTPCSAAPEKENTMDFGEALHQGAPEEESIVNPETPTPTPAQPAEHILQFFAYGHLPPHLAMVSKPFCELAHALVLGDNQPDAVVGRVTLGGPLPRNPEREVALRKLLEAKDAAVRALVAR